MQKKIQYLFELSFLIFAFTLPLISYPHIIFKCNIVTVIPFAFLTFSAFGLIIFYSKNKKTIVNGFPAKITSFFVIIYFIQSMIWNLWDLYLYGDFIMFVRVSLFYSVLPFVFFLTIYYSKDVWKFLKTIMISGIIVAIEYLYEIFSTNILCRPTLFQIKYFEYVFSLTGDKLYQLIGSNYRPPGLLEHVHATALFLYIVALVGYALYIKTKKRFYIISSGIIFSAAFYSGARLIFFAFMLAFVFLVLITACFDKKNLGALFRATASSVIFLTLFYFIFYPYSQVIFVFFGQLLNGEISPTLTFFSQPGVTGAGNSFLGSILSMTKEYLGTFFSKPWMFLIGYGPCLLHGYEGILNDDFFLLSIFSSMGLIIFSFFISTLFVILVSSLKMFVNNVIIKDFSLSAVCCCVLLIMVLSLLHSGALFRKGNLWLLFVFLAIICRMLYACPKVLNFSYVNWTSLFRIFKRNEDNGQ